MAHLSSLRHTWYLYIRNSRALRKGIEKTDPCPWRRSNSAKMTTDARWTSLLNDRCV
jgi:hypothetical protein